MSISIEGKAAFLADPLVKALFAALSAGGEEARVVGGAVRNTLLGLEPGDIDFAATTQPQETIARVEAAGFRAVPTGIAHGTITAVSQGRGFEITTLRADIATNGRHAEVRFGRDWREDAARRDFTINALACDETGAVHDYHGGIADIASRTVRFIGDAETRIREDHLRSLRFYRFFAWYGAGRPDADGIRATAKLKAGLAQLSAERVWAELKKLLSAPDPARALLWMRQAGVLTSVLPESERWGIDAIPGLIAAERALHWPADPMLRLMAITPPDPERVAGMAQRLKLSKAERTRLEAQAGAAAVPAGTSETALAKRLYREGEAGITGCLRLALASARARATGEDAADGAAMMDAALLGRLLAFAMAWQRPVFPVTGRDLQAMGHAEGAALGATLKAMETRWIDSGFKLAKADLLG
jgi:poly(A) polymerase